VNVAELPEHLRAFADDQLLHLSVSLLAGRRGWDAGGQLELAGGGAAPRRAPRLLLPLGEPVLGTHHIQPAPEQKTQRTTNNCDTCDDDVSNHTLGPIHAQRHGSKSECGQRWDDDPQKSSATENDHARILKNQQLDGEPSSTMRHHGNHAKGHVVKKDAMK